MTTIKNCDWEKKKKRKEKPKLLIGFLSDNKINNYNAGEVGRGRKKRKKKYKRIYRTSKNKNNKCFSWVTFLRVLSCAYLTRMPSNTVLISGPAVEAAQILIWSYASVFLPPMSTAVRDSSFSFAGTLNILL